MDKRYIIIGAGVLLIIVLGIVMFTSGKKAAKVTPTAKLVIWDSFDSEENFRQAITYFEGKNSKIKVEYVKKNPATYETDSINAIADGNGPDIWVVPSNWMPKHHEKMATMPEKTLDPKLTNAEAYKNLFVDAANKDNVYDSQVYGVPLFMDTLSLFYNNRLVSKKYDAYVQAHPNADLANIEPLFDNVPQTWDELTSLIKYYGPNAIALGATNVEQYSDILNVLMLQYGAQMTSEDKANALFHTSSGTNDFTPYPGAKALTFFTSFAKEGDANYTWSPGEKSAYEAFVQNKVAMMINYTQIQKQLAKENDEFRIKALPQINKIDNPIDLAYYQVMTVPKNAVNQSAAWTFIGYFPDAQARLDARYLSATGLPSAKIAEIRTSNDAVDIQNRNSVTWYNPDPAKVSEIFKNAIDQSLSGQNPQTLMEGAAAQVTTLLSNLKGTK